MRRCSEYLLFKQSSTELSAIIGWGRDSSVEGGGTDWGGGHAGAGGADGGGEVHAPADITIAARIKRRVFIFIRTSFLKKKGRSILLWLLQFFRPDIGILNFDLDEPAWRLLKLEDTIAFAVYLKYSGNIAYRFGGL